jgi:recombination associated protein RdgC
MGFQKGRLTVRRYRVHEPVTAGFRDAFERGLSEHAFRDPGSASSGEETVGWVLADNLLSVDFHLRDRWLFDHYLLAGLRIDKCVLPGPLVRAHVDLRTAAWCREHSQARCPAGVRTEIRAAVETELLARSLPRVRMVPVCWHLGEGWVLVHSTSTRVNDLFRKLFRNTFGVVPEPFSPLDILSDTPDLSSALASTGTTDFRGVAP